MWKNNPSVFWDESKMIDAIAASEEYENLTIGELREFLTELNIDSAQFQGRVDLARRVGRHVCVGDAWDKGGINWGQQPDGKLLWAAMKIMCPTIEKKDAKWINERVLPHLFKLESYKRLDDAVNHFWQWARCCCGDEPNPTLYKKIKNM